MPLGNAMWNPSQFNPMRRQTGDPGAPYYGQQNPHLPQSPNIPSPYSQRFGVLHNRGLLGTPQSRLPPGMRLGDLPAAIRPGDAPPQMFSTPGGFIGPQPQPTPQPALSQLVVGRSLGAPGYAPGVIPGAAQNNPIQPYGVPGSVLPGQMPDLRGQSPLTPQQQPIRDQALNLQGIMAQNPWGTPQMNQAFNTDIAAAQRSAASAGRDNALGGISWASPGLQSRVMGQQANTLAGALQGAASDFQADAARQAAFDLANQRLAGSDMANQLGNIARGQALNQAFSQAAGNQMTDTLGSLLGLEGQLGAVNLQDAAAGAGYDVASQRAYGQDLASQLANIGRMQSMNQGYTQAGRGQMTDTMAMLLGLEGQLGSDYLKDAGLEAAYDVGSQRTYGADLASQLGNLARMQGLNLGFSNAGMGQMNDVLGNLFGLQGSLTGNYLQDALAQAMYGVQGRRAYGQDWASQLSNLARMQGMNLGYGATGANQLLSAIMGPYSSLGGMVGNYLGDNSFRAYA